MTTPQLQAWLGQKDRQVSMLIRQYGCYIKYVFGETELETPFAYSVGFFGLGHPELLMFGADEETTSHVINTLFERVQDGDDLTQGELVTFDDWPHRVLVESVPNPAEILLGAYRHYRLPATVLLPALQLTWDDRSGHFPWDADYSIPEWVQPRPGSFRA